MAYGDQDRIEAIFGTTAIDRWSDIDNDGNATTKAARIVTALAWAYAEVNSLLRCAPYTIPLANGDGDTPQAILEVEATLAGIWLYEAKGTKDISPEGKGFHRYEFRKNWAYQVLDEIVVGHKRKLDAL